MKQLTLVCALVLCIGAPAIGENTQSASEAAWDYEWKELTAQISKGATSGRFKAEALDAQALILSGDKDPLDIVLRRTKALIDHFKQDRKLTADAIGAFEKEFTALSAKARAVEVSKSDSRRRFYNQVCALRRKIALANPLLNFDSIICMLEPFVTHRIVEGGRPFGYKAGGGLIVVSGFKSKPTVSKPLTDTTVSSGPWKGKKLHRKFAGLELDYDARKILFTATTDTDIWRIFKYDLASKKLDQLTTGPDDDFDPCFLPSGRIAFVSTRVGGIGRCLLRTQSLTYTLYSMEADGSDITPLSYHETNEWQPSVNNRGMIVYTRWDYLDRDWSTAHHHWQCYPDGTDPRSYHGNYPLPHSAMPEGVEPNQYGRKDKRLIHGRYLRPDVEISYRAIPGTASKYTAAAVGHHMGFSGSLILVDTNIPDDSKMAQVKRITPLSRFPEVERPADRAYGTPWPLSEDFYLCNFKTGLYLLDRYGNREVIYDPKGAFLVRDPFPLRPRRKPPVLPVKTWDGKRANLPDHRRATISIMNVYEGDMPLPKGVKVKSMRIVQVIPQLLTRINRAKTKLISYADESVGRIPLGVVPVESDGSVFCEAPVGKPIYFQLLDEKGFAVQSMRSVTYVHPGEQMRCIGCHEDKWKSPANTARPMALRRGPSKIVQEVKTGAVPLNFLRLVKRPVFDKKCVACHEKHKDKKAPDMSYASLAKPDLLFTLHGTHFQFRGGDQCLHCLGIGGSRTTPGRFGAQASGFMASLKKKYHKDVKLTDDELRRITLWLDLNANEICWISDDAEVVNAQKRGEIVWPPRRFVDPKNITAVETARPLQIAAPRN
ncbi:MAG: hypothetical protein QGG42_18305 [Phycisphaerae bacterium]|jgi:hypothetical protein|nr:hypothetical protein [Phycisphaerae bacterium]